MNYRFFNVTVFPVEKFIAPPLYPLLRNSLHALDCWQRCRMYLRRRNLHNITFYSISKFWQISSIWCMHTWFQITSEPEIKKMWGRIVVDTKLQSYEEWFCFRTCRADMTTYGWALCILNNISLVQFWNDTIQQHCCLSSTSNGTCIPSHSYLWKRYWKSRERELMRLCCRTTQSL